MNVLPALALPFSQSVIERLGWVLVHSLWQFALVALAAGLAAQILRRRSAGLRYGVLVVALVAIVAAPVMTWAMQQGGAASLQTARVETKVSQTEEKIPASQAPPIAGDREKSSMPRAVAPDPEERVVLPAPTWSERITTTLRPWLAWIVAAWCLGVVVCSLRPLLGWHTLRRLRRVGVSPAPDRVVEALGRVAGRLGLRRGVGVLQSTLIHVPVLVGYARPVILLPVSLVTGIPAAQLDAILAHELAHARRHDFLVNLLQTVIETIFFYHPAVWWLSRQIRIEREHCCDDLVIHLLDNRLDYGRALVAIEQGRGQSTVLALGATDGSLLSRVRRIAGAGADRGGSLATRGAAALIGVLLVGGAIALAMNWRPTPRDEKGPQPVNSNALTTDDKTTAPKPDAKPALRITGRVLDADTGQPIARSRMVPTSVDREDAELTWQSQYLKEFTEGRYVYETDRPWDKIKLRIEADGYRPVMTRAVSKGEKSVEIDVKLARDSVGGIVLLPNGRPAAKAQVAVASHTNEVTVGSGKLSYTGHGARLRKVAEADDQGRFELPAEIDTSVLVVAHDAGYAETILIPPQAPANAPDVNKAAGANQALKITVQPWGRVEGRILARDKPVAGAKYWVYQARSDEVFVWAHEHVKTDAEGRFVIERIPSGRHGVCQRSVDNKSGNGSHAISGVLVRFDIPAGKTTALNLGSPGRTLVGKLVLPDGFPYKIDWSKVSLRVSLQPPPWNRFGDDDNAAGQSWSDFLQTDEGKLYGRENVAIDADGKFRIEGLPPAEYQLIVQATGQAAVTDQKPDGTILRGDAKFPVPAVAPGAAPMDLNPIKLTTTVAKKIARVPEGRAEPRPEDIFARKVSLNANGMALEDALRAVARSAGLEVRVDAAALAQVKLDVTASVTVTIKDERLDAALTRLIPWDRHPGAFRVVRGGKLVITTLQASQLETQRHLPDWLKPLYNHGLTATVDEDYNVVAMTTGEVLSDELLGKLRTLPKLRELDIGSTKLLTPAGLENLAQLSSLHKLSLFSLSHDGKGLGDAALQHIVSLKSLRELHLNDCGTTDVGIRILEKMPQLEHLDIYQEVLLTDAALASIARLKNLKHLGLSSYVGTVNGWMRFSKEATASLADLQNLEHLHLVGQAIAAETLKFPRLKSLSLGTSAVDDNHAARIAECRQLESLNLVYTNISDGGLNPIASLPQLTYLNLDSHTITDAGIQHLARAPKLQDLYLRASRLTDDSLPHLAQIKTLTSLHLHGSGEPGAVVGKCFTIEGLQRLKALPNLRTLSLTNLESRGGFLGLKELTQLHELPLMMTNIRDDELDALQEALPNARISHCTGAGMRVPRRK